MKFSVIIPAYNAKQYIAKAIESCLNQSYPPHEIIVVDDGSTDGTAAVAESFPPPVRVIRLAKNMGLTTARNQGVQASTGNWLAFLDADDWFLPKKLEQQRQCALENEQAVLIYSRFFTSLKGVETPARFTPPAKLWPALRFKCGLQICTVILRRDAFDAVGGFDVALRVCEDWDLWLRLAKCYSTARFDAVPEPLAVYRITPGSLSSNAMRMFKAKAALIECQCLHGTTGLSRYLLRRRISAFLHYDTAIALREEGSLLDLPFIFKSIALWPFPGNEIPLKRYKVAAVMLKQHLFRSIARLISLTKETPSYKD